MTKCHQLSFYNKKDLQFNFNGGDITSDAGLLLIKEFDNKLNLSKRMANCVKDERDINKITYTIEELFNQRIYSWLAGYEDCNDANKLKNDPAIKAIVNRKDFSKPVASQSTLSRLENMVDMKDIFRMQKLLIGVFVESFGDKIPEKLIIDVDGTDDPAHGAQQLTMFNGHYGQNMYRPLIISSNNHILDALLRKGNVHDSRSMITRLQFVIGELKKSWPDVKIIIRIDAGGAVPAIYEFCEFNEFEYVIGLIGNSRLKKESSELSKQAKKEYKKTKIMQQLFGETIYRAEKWDKARRVIMKAKYIEEKSHTRYLVTNLDKNISPENLYKDYYSPRGDFERIIGDLKNGFKGDRLSCHCFIANQFRLLMAVFQYEIIELFRNYCLEGTEYRTAQPETLRRALIKIGARVKETTRKLWVECCSSYPYKKLIDLIIWRIEKIPQMA